MEELENEISTQVEENTVSLASAQALADALANIEVYTPTTWVDNSSPDIDAEHLNKPEQAIKRVTDALNSAVDVIKDLQSQVTKNAGDISTVNNNLSKCNIGYSYNGTDGTNAIYTAIPDGSTVWFSINGNTKVGQELGLSQQYEGAEIIIWKSSDWRGGALAIGGDGLRVMIGQNNGSNSIKWNPLALKDDLSNFVVARQISADVTIPNGSPYSTSTHDITCDIPSGYKYVGILRAWCIDQSCFVWNAYFRDEGKNAKIDVSNLNGTQKNTKLYISVLYAKS